MAAAELLASNSYWAILASWFVVGQSVLKKIGAKPCLCEERKQAFWQAVASLLITLISQLACRQPRPPAPPVPVDYCARVVSWFRKLLENGICAAGESLDAGHMGSGGREPCLTCTLFMGCRGAAAMVGDQDFALQMVAVCKNVSHEKCNNCTTKGGISVLALTLFCMPLVLKPRRTGLRQNTPSLNKSNLLHSRSASVVSCCSRCWNPHAWSLRLVWQLSWSQLLRIFWLTAPNSHGIAT